MLIKFLSYDLENCKLQQIGIWVKRIDIPNIV